MIGDVVLVTGATGFIASHCVQQLIEFGYRVRGTVRNLKDEELVAPLKQLFPTLQVVQADLTKDAGWDAALRGCKYVLHVASPFTTGGELEQFYPAAVDGTMRVLRAARKAGVQHVVLTSSVAAVSSGRSEPEEHVFSEEDWSDTDSPTCPPYDKSKTLAERAAWNFHKSIPTARDKFKLTTINPGYVQGPLLLKRSPTSLLLAQRLLRGEVPATPKFMMSIVDVRDVARAHIEALLRPKESNGQRYILVASNCWLPDIAQLLADQYNSKGFKCSTMTAPYPLLWFLAKMGDKEMKSILPAVNKTKFFSNEKACEQLGLKLRSYEESIVDMCNAAIRDGLITPPSALPTTAPAGLAVACTAAAALAIGGAIVIRARARAS